MFCEDKLLITSYRTARNGTIFTFDMNEKTILLSVAYGNL